MSWKLAWTRRALKDVKRLDPQVKKRIVKALERLVDRGAGDILRLQNVQPPEWRLRVGDWRVRFRKHSDREIFEILRLQPRDKAY